jgi:hypothetical protein
MSTVGHLGEFPKTAEFFRKLIEFSGNLDFCKVLLSEGNIIISSLVRLSQINTPADLKFQFKEVAECAGEFAAQFERDRK